MSHKLPKPHKCRFCDMFKQGFSVSPLEEVEADIQEIRVRYSSVPRVFLSGGNALTVPYDHLVQVLQLIIRYLRPRYGVGCFGRITDVARLSDDQLASLRNLGLNDISIGAETGYNPALSFMQKGFTAADIVEQSARLDAADMYYDFFYLAGMAGAGKCVEAAEASARVFNQTHPRRIMIHTMTAFQGTPLWDDIQTKRFVPAPEIEVLQDMRTLIANLNGPTFILGAHYANTIRVNGFVPGQRNLLLEPLDRAIEFSDEADLERFRSSITTI